jgi:hypothetical protein
MSNESLSAIATRVRLCKEEGPEVAYAHCLGLHYGAYIDDCGELAEAWLAEHPADDETLVDVEWLATRKAISHDENSRHWWTIDSCVTFRIRDDGISIWIGDHFVMANPTRGDVRRLCRALRVELGEQR